MKIQSITTGQIYSKLDGKSTGNKRFCENIWTVDVNMYYMYINVVCIIQS